MYAGQVYQLLKTLCGLYLVYTVFTTPFLSVKSRTMWLQWESEVHIYPYHPFPVTVILNRPIIQSWLAWTAIRVKALKWIRTAWQRQWETRSLRNEFPSRRYSKTHLLLPNLITHSAYTLLESEQYKADQGYFSRITREKKMDRKYMLQRGKDALILAPSGNQVLYTCYIELGETRD